MTLILSGTDGLSDIDGSAATPAIRGTDTNTGIFFPAADTMAMATGGTEAMRIDSSGNITVKDKIQFGTDPQTNIQAGGTSDVDLIVAADTNIRFETATNEQARITSAGLFQFNSGYGSVATAYGCRAWVNFNGTGVVAIRASGNVSSITDNGVGTYVVNLTSAMPDANYSVVSGRVSVGSTADASTALSISSTSAIALWSGWNGSSGNTYTLEDAAQIFVSVFR